MTDDKVATSQRLSQEEKVAMVAFLIPATIFGLGIDPSVALHEGSTLVVAFNALRQLAYRDPTAS